MKLDLKNITSSEVGLKVTVGLQARRVALITGLGFFVGMAQ
jgi:hypothetical protein